MAEPIRLLVVDDDAEILELLRRYFVAQDFEVCTAVDGSEMRGVLARTSIDLVLLDLGLPGEDGFALTRQLHEQWAGPVIIITGRGESVDRVIGLELGADDYVTKPFDLRELLARVRSVLRRSNRARQSSAGDEHAALHFSGFRLDPLARELFTADGERVALTAGEYELLRLFVDNPNRVLSRDDLMERIHGREAGPFDRAIDVRIGRLRRKIESDPSDPEIIKSVRGAGYVFATRVSRGES
ncbi:MAG: response regulator [Lysobacterales bacterium]